jgi:hypothetical protein
VKAGPEDFEELFNLYVRANVEPDISPSELFPHLLKLHSSPETVRTRLRLRALSLMPAVDHVILALRYF